MKILSKFFLPAAILFLFSACKTEKNYITQVINPADNRPPEVSWITSPESQLRGTVGIDVGVRDSSRIARTELYFDGRAADSLTAAPWRFTLQTDSITVGVHLLEARAWDEFGNMGVSPILRVYVASGIPEGIRLLWVPDDFTRIQDAINASQDFDTIRVRDGIYYETLNAFGKGIWIESEHGPTRCTVDNARANNAYLIIACQVPVTVRGFRITGAGYLISLIDGAQARIYNNILLSDSTDGTFLASNNSGMIHNNLFRGSSYGVQIAYFLGSFYNNIIDNVNHVAFWNASVLRNPLIYGYNVFWNNGQNYGFFSPGPGDLITDPFIDINQGQLETNSPCINTGNPDILDRDRTRSDIGPFGGPYAY
jgi:hypothetical protein